MKHFDYKKKLTIELKVMLHLRCIFVADSKNKEQMDSNEFYKILNLFNSLRYCYGPGAPFDLDAPSLPVPTQYSHKMAYKEVENYITRERMSLDELQNNCPSGSTLVMHRG